MCIEFARRINLGTLLLSAAAAAAKQVHTLLFGLLLGVLHSLLQFLNEIVNLIDLFRHILIDIVLVDGSAPDRSEFEGAFELHLHIAKRSDDRASKRGDQNEQGENIGVALFAAKRAQTARFNTKNSRHRGFESVNTVAITRMRQKFTTENALGNSKRVFLKPKIDAKGFGAEKVKRRERRHLTQRGTALHGLV